MRSKLVSVIIPAYNAAIYIKDCIDSVLNQTYENLEIIVINDGSTDSTFEILDKIKDERLVIINQDNKGCSAAKNVGLGKSSGDFIQYLDADDLLSLDKIECQVRCLESKALSIAVCKTVIIGLKNEDTHGEIDTDMLKKEGSGLDFLLRLLGSEGAFGMVQPNSFLIPRKLIEIAGPWQTDFSPCPDEDGEYFSRILVNSDFVYFTGGINHYRKIKNGGSLSNLYDPIRVMNQLKTIERKFDNIFTKDSSIGTKNLYQINVSNTVYQLAGHELSLISTAVVMLQKQGFNDFKLSGSGKFHLISLVLGFRNTYYLRWLMLKLINIF